MASEAILCPRCKQPASGLYQSRIGLLCFACLDEEDSSVVDRYEGWRDRELERERRAQIARKNFTSAPPPSIARRFKREGDAHVG